MASPVWKYEYVPAWPKQTILPSYVDAPTGVGARVGVTSRSSRIGFPVWSSPARLTV
jgi:hypothetical protein